MEVSPLKHSLRLDRDTCWMLQTFSILSMYRKDNHLWTIASNYSKDRVNRNTTVMMGLEVIKSMQGKALISPIHMYRTVSFDRIKCSTATRMDQSSSLSLRRTLICFSMHQSRLQMACYLNKQNSTKWSSHSCAYSWRSETRSTGMIKQFEEYQVNSHHSKWRRWNWPIKNGVTKRSCLMRRKKLKKHRVLASSPDLSPLLNKVSHYSSKSLYVYKRQILIIVALILARMQ